MASGLLALENFGSHPVSCYVSIFGHESLLGTGR